MQLDKESRTHLIQIAKDFYEKTKFKAPVKDIYLMGSAANYNWTPDSDLDVHIVIDFNQLQMPQDTAEKVIKNASSNWNEEHDIVIKGHKVEMNIQPVSDQKPHVTGIYSLVKNQWIRVPQLQYLNVNRISIVSKYNKLKGFIEHAIQMGERDHMKSVKEYVDAFRQYGLDTKGELSTENIVFKILRSRGILKKLKNAITDTYDAQMSLNEIDYIGSTYMNQLKGVPVPDALKTVHDDHSMISGVNSQNWRYLGGKNKVLWNTKPSKEDIRKVTVWLSQQGIHHPVHTVMHSEGYGAGVPETDRLHVPGERWRIRSKDAPKTPKMTDEVVNVEKIAEVTQKDIRQVAPKPDAMYKGAIKWDRMTLDNLMHLKKKMQRMMPYYRKQEDPNFLIQIQAARERIDQEIAKRLAVINKPVMDAFDPTSVGPNPAASEGQYDTTYYDDQNDRMRQMGKI